MSTSNENFYAGIPASVPRTNHTLLNRFGKWLFAAMGWRYEGELPDVAKAVVLVAPHTSNWDFFIGCVAKFALNLKASYIMKREAFFWPFKNWLIGIGGIPIDRSQPASFVAQVTDSYNKQDELWLVITPEGTRKKVTHFKTGFARIAWSAQVPIIVVGFDYQKKAIVFSKVVTPTGDHEQDAEALYHFCRDNFSGRNPQFQ